MDNSLGRWALLLAIGMVLSTGVVAAELKIGFVNVARVLDKAPQAERARTRVAPRHDLEPALGSHAFDVAAEGGGIHLQAAADVGRPQHVAVCSQHQQAHLAHLQLQRAQRLIVQAGDGAVNQAQLSRGAFALDPP